MPVQQFETFVGCAEGDQLHNVGRYMITIGSKPALRAVMNSLFQFFCNRFTTDTGLAVTADAGSLVGSSDVAGAEL